MLIDMVANLPAMAMWVLVGFFAYKVVIIGSVYGLVRFGISQFVVWRTWVKPTPDIRYTFLNKTINEDVSLALTAQIARIMDTKYGYIHMTDVQKLQRAIDNMEQKNVK